MKRMLTNVSKSILFRRAKLAQIVMFQLDTGDKSYAELLAVATKAKENYTNQELFACIGFLIKECRIGNRDGKWSLLRHD